MIEDIFKEITETLAQTNEELRNGAIIASIVINAFKEFEIDFNLIEKAVNTYSQKVSILSLSNIIEDRKIRTKYNSLIHKFLSDSYASVRRAAAFSEPLLWYWEKEKNQKALVDKLIKNNEKFSTSYIEGILLGLGVVSKQLTQETQDEILKLYEVIIENYSDEEILVSASYGIALYAITSKNSKVSIPLLLKLIQSPGKKIRSSSAYALSFLVGEVEFESSLEIISYLVIYSSYQESWPVNLAIILTYFCHSSPDQKERLLDYLDNIERKDPELQTILELLEEDSDLLTFSTDAATTHYSQIRLSVLFASYYFEKHTEELDLKEEDLKKFAMLCVVLLGDKSSNIRSFSLYRLLSLSISLNTAEYLEFFQALLDDKQQKNRSLAATAIIYLTILYNSEKLPEIRTQLRNYKDPQIKKGILLGLGMGFNPKIHQSEIADEQVLGLLELTGESKHIGFILIISSLM